MGYPFEVFGVGADTDEKSLKRAYATLVRQHRPDKDPEAFAHVQSAYERALAIRQAQGWSSDPGDAEAEDEAEDDAVDQAAFDIVFAPPMTLTELVARVGEEAAVWIVNRATDDLLLAGEAHYLARELSSDTAERLLTLNVGIEPAMLKTAGCVAFSEPQTAARLLDRIKLGGGHYAELEGRAVLTLSHAEAFHQAGCASLPRELYRFATLLLFVDGESRLGLIDEVLRFARQDPMDFSVRIVRLPPDLLGALGGREVEPEAQVDTQDHGPSETRIKEVLEGIAENMPLTRVHWLWTASWVGSLVLTGYLWHWLGLLGTILGVILCIVALLARPVYLDMSLFGRHMCVPLVEFVLQSGVSPNRLIEVMRQYSRATGVARFDRWVRYDPRLSLAYRLATARRAVEDEG